MNEQKVTPTEAVEQDLNEILRIRREKLSKLVADGKNPFEVTKFNKTHSSAQIIDGYVDHAEGEEYEPQIVSVAGRMVSRGIMGQARICHLLDGEGPIHL